MSSDVALRVRNLGKRYTIRHRDHDHVTLAQAALHRLRHPRGGMTSEAFWALQEVDFDVPRGEVLAVMGHNGAGKSTLLKLMSRITPPTTGRIEVHGRIGSLLEVGTGFHPELTGRENVYLNGSILGMRTKEIDRQFDDIVAFSGVDNFLDTPVKRFSSGMYVRLAFAVAAHLSTEILLLDEVLAVGDADFQRRCVSKMRDVAHDGRTVLLVSHNLNTVKDLAHSAVLLERGRTVMVGAVGAVMERYRAKEGLDTCSVDLLARPRPVHWMPGTVRLEHVALHSDEGRPAIQWASTPQLTIRLAGREEVAPVRFSITVRDADGNGVGLSEGPTVVPPRPGTSADYSVRLPPLRLRPGTYTLDLAVANLTLLSGRVGIELDKVADALAFEVLDAAVDGSAVGPWWPGFGSLDLGPLATEPLSVELGGAEASTSLSTA